MTQLQVAAPVIETVLEDVRAWGQRPAESGAFLLAPVQTADRISVAAIAGEDGVRRARDLFLVSGAAIERVFTWADKAGLRVRAQIHSHRGPAFLSMTDLRHGFNVAGFVTAVVPQYASPPTDPRDWGWWQFESQSWRECQPPAILPETAGSLVVFDARGVRDR